MLFKKNRLNKEKDFLRLLKQGQKYFSPTLILKVLPNKLPDTRFGFIITKKNSKKAVLRNKIKRQLREIIRRDIKNGIKNGLDLVFLIKKDIDLTKIKYQILRQEIIDLIKKAKI